MIILGIITVSILLTLLLIVIKDIDKLLIEQNLPKGIYTTLAMYVAGVSILSIFLGILITVILSKL